MKAASLEKEPGLNEAGDSTTRFEASVDNAVDLDSMKKIAAFMRDNLPVGTSLAIFGKRMKWGRRNLDALGRIGTITVKELRRLGLTADQAKNWAVAYEAVSRVAPTNPSARGRAELMRRVAKLLEGK